MKVKVKFLKSLYPYRAWEIWELDDVMSSFWKAKWYVEEVKEAKGENKSMKSRKKKTKKIKS